MSLTDQIVGKTIDKSGNRYISEKKSMWINRREKKNGRKRKYKHQHRKRLFYIVIVAGHV